MPHAQLVLLEKIEVYGRTLGDVALLEQLHDLRIIGGVELTLQVIEFAYALIVQLTVFVTLQERHGQLIHRIVLTVLAVLDPIAEELDEPVGSDIRTLVEALDLIALDLDLEVPVLDGITPLVIRAQLPVVLQDLVERRGLPDNDRVELLHNTHRDLKLPTGTLDELRAQRLIRGPLVVGGRLLLGPLLLEKLGQLVGRHLL